MTKNNKLEITGHRHVDAHAHAHAHSNEHEHSHDHDITDDDEVQEPFRPAIVFDAQHLGEEVPVGFDAVRILLDGTVKGDLGWQREREAAAAYVHQGLRILWEINLGLFDHLKYPISNQTQFLSLSLSLEHFRDTLWQQFRRETFGLCLYRGAADMSLGCKWDEELIVNLQGWLKDFFEEVSICEQHIGLKFSDFGAVTPEKLRTTLTGCHLLSLFCSDAAGEYLQLLAARLPDTITPFVLLDASACIDHAHKAQLLSKERYPHISVGVKNGSRFGGEFVWEGKALPAGNIARSYHSFEIDVKPRYGVCLPPLLKDSFRNSSTFNDIFAALIKRQDTFKVIPESLLTTEWDGLDYLIVVSHLLSPQGRRKVQGFCAAGGTVVVVGDALGLPDEQNFAHWLDH